MDHLEKVRLAIAELKKRKADRRRLPVAPPTYRLLLALGFVLPPPPFWGFWARGIWFAVPFALGFGAYCALWGWIAGDPLLSWPGVLFSTCFYGVASAATHRRDPDLPRWHDYRPIPPGTFE